MKTWIPLVLPDNSVVQIGFERVECGNLMIHFPKRIWEFPLDDMQLPPWVFSEEFLELIDTVGPRVN